MPAFSLSSRLALVAAAAALALTLDSVSDNGNLVDTSFTTATQISSDVGFLNASAVTLSFTLDAADVAAGSVPFNAIVDQLQPGEAFGTLALWLSGGAVFGTFGGVETLASGASVTLQPGAGGASVRVSVLPTSAELLLGDPLMLGSASDWSIGFGALAAGDRFSLSLQAVPEPGSAALALAGLCSLGALRRRGR